jgi:cytidylate kinase
VDQKKIKIAIDGPAASGKSTTARLVAQKLDYTYIDSGAMYRAVTLNALQNRIPPADAGKVAEIAKKIVIEFRQSSNDIEVIMNGEDVSKAIRIPDVTNNIGPVAANPRVRENLVVKQRMLGKNGGVVMDGRDITTVVFPDAELKIYMKASAEERARRRVKELMQRGIKADYNEILQAIIDRDHADFSREHGPLKQAPGAVVIDTTKLTIEEQVEKIYHLALKVLQKLPRPKPGKY